MTVDLPLAFSAGLLTVAAPCILPMLPILLGAGSTGGGRLRPMFIATGFVLAFAGCALLFGAFADTLGLAQEALRNGAIALLALFGVSLLWPRPFELLAARIAPLLNGIDIGRHAGPGNLGGLVLGAGLGIVWTPCAGPAFAAILALVAAAHSPGRSGLLLLLYASGAAIPMLAIAYGGQLAQAHVRRVARHAHAIRRVAGVLITVTALAMYFQYDTLAAAWLTNLASEA
ncbi:cytochrome c biogenesis CcdA family protein [Pseudoduganella armeniaca]|uniref:Cytochrome C biogenesis protein n=1 Tax=Pseudoduganella armeniaca TaxID=2072590 RepID=A0A2R4CG36_9BURK|nr:cytochrome c biogenesis protein CcdA [Pseudoduganella armeniaca]AVR98545.1 cytochrome C biogenesis protein [Pseudoduganella armeniaca]